ncbi:hypothetical protein L596_013925 [Steinernema carpocapsae]|uniref:Uncharacterized protein n=1 Tax=Steinernema carpocapsae TaxID=34508 RepID=A0A4U5P1N9_STECR|nr:hypothetical protein L596_013925 [Steinernema carpocapsae]
MLGSDSIEKVVNFYFHAITAVRPRTRYLYGWGAKIYLIPGSYLPTGLLDFLVRYVTYETENPAALKCPK